MFYFRTAGAVKVTPHGSGPPVGEPLAWLMAPNKTAQPERYNLMARAKTEVFVETPHHGPSMA